MLSARRGEPPVAREVWVASVSAAGVVEDTSVVAHPADPLIDAFRCLELEGGELLIVGRARSGAIVALQSDGGAWEAALVLGAGGYEVQVHELARLRDGRFVAVGAKELKGFVVLFDPTTHTAHWRDWEGGAGASLIVDAKPGDDSLTICGLEAESPGELLSSSSTVFVASLDGSGSVRRTASMPGRACRLLAGMGPEERIRMLHEGVETVPGPLHLLELDETLETAAERQLLGEIFHFYLLKSAESAESFAVLNQRPVRESIEVFAIASGLLLGSSRLGVFPTGDMDIVAFGGDYLVISQPLAAETARRTPRIDFFDVP
ncbi:MAG TPA: hypothetical protein VMS86_02495 [Thermoanaerobaculia bacterium]|nr:hypothetical protein [Thermoanaerobaculia bacterium]